jgi:hypothetical protein
LKIIHSFIHSFIHSSSSSSSSCLYHINSAILRSSTLNSAYISVIMAIYELLFPSFSDPWTTLSLSIALAQYHVTAPGLSSPSHKMSSLHIYHIGWCIVSDEWIMMVMNTRTINQSINQSNDHHHITIIIFIIIIKSSYSGSYRKWSSKKNSSTRW